LKASSNDCAQDIFGRGGFIEGAPNGVDLGGPDGLLQHLGIESQFIAKVIIYGGDICSGAHANFANGGRLIAAIGKNLLRNLEQFVARGIGGTRFTIAPRCFRFPACVIGGHFQTLV
jgi:hypothetical protein